MIQVLYILLFLSSGFCFEADWKVDENGFRSSRINLRHSESEERLSSVDQCKPVLIEQSWSVSVKCLKNYPYIVLDVDDSKSRLIQMELELWLPENMRDYEIEIHNATGANKYPEWVSIPNTRGLDRKRWTTLTWFFPHLQKTENPIAHINFSKGNRTTNRRNDIVKSKPEYKKFFKNFDFTAQFFYGSEFSNTYIYDLEGAYIRGIKIKEIDPIVSEESDKILNQWIRNDTTSLLNQQDILKVVFAIFLLISIYLIISSPRRIASQLWLVILPLVLGLFLFSPTIVFQIGDSMDLALKQRIYRALNESYEKILKIHKQAQKQGILEIDQEIRQLEFNPLKENSNRIELGSIERLKYIESVFAEENRENILNLYNETSDLAKKILARYENSTHPFWISKISEYSKNYQRKDNFESLEQKFKNIQQIKNWIHKVHPVCFVLDRIKHDYDSEISLISPTRYFEHNRHGLGNETQLRIDYRLIARRLAAELNSGNGSKEDDQFRELRSIIKNYGGDSLDLQSVLEEPLSPTSFLHSNVSQTYEDFFWSWINFGEENFIIAGMLQHRFVSHRTFQLIQSNLIKELNSMGIQILLKRRDHRPDYPKTLYNQKHLMKFAVKTHHLEKEITEAVIHNNQKRLMAGRSIPLARTYLCLDLNLDKWFKQHRNKKNFIFWMIILGTVSIYLIIHFLTLGLLKPFNQVDQKLNQVIKGNFDVAIPQHVTRDLNQLSTDLAYLIKQLRETEDLTGFLSGAAVDNIRDLRPTQSEKVCVLFCGIFGMEKFNAAEQMSALSKFLNGVQIILAQQGAMIDKFTGAACLAIFQSELISDAPLKASEAILKWKKDTDFELDICIGLASGKAMLGHVGSEQRKDYTCIGDTVNLAARLETLSKSRGLPMNQIYLDKQTFLLHQNTHWKFDTLEPISIKGKAGLQEVYALQT